MRSKRAAFHTHAQTHTHTPTHTNTCGHTRSHTCTHIWSMCKTKQKTQKVKMTQIPFCLQYF